MSTTDPTPGEDAFEPGDRAESRASRNSTPLQPPAPEDSSGGEPAGREDVSGAARAGVPLGGSLGRTVQSGLAGEAITSRGVLDAIGGWRGILETLVPGVLFLVIFTFTRDAKVAAIAPAALAVIAIVIRLLRKETLTSALSGAIGVGFAVAATLLTGKGEDYYLPGFLTNAAWILGLGVSLLIGWPILGFALGAFRGDLTGWRKDRALKRAATWVTLLWLAMFAARLAVQLPLYLAAKNGADATATDALGVARLVMGIPLFALVVVFTWMVLGRLAGSSDDSEAESEATQGENPRSA